MIFFSVSLGLNHYWAFEYFGLKYYPFLEVPNSMSKENCCLKLKYCCYIAIGVGILYNLFVDGSFFILCQLICQWSDFTNDFWTRSAYEWVNMLTWFDLKSLSIFYLIFIFKERMIWCQITSHQTKKSMDSFIFSTILRIWHGSRPRNNFKYSFARSRLVGITKMLFLDVQLMS